MENVLKNFLIIFFVSLGMGLTYVIRLRFPAMGSLFFGFCIIIDLMVIMKVLCSCRTQLYGLFSTFTSSFLLIAISFSLWQFSGMWVKSCFFALGFSFFIASLALPFWGFIIFCEKIFKHWGGGFAFFPLFLIKKNWYIWI